MTRTSFYLLVALVAGTAGCNGGGVSPGPDLEHASPVTFGQFRDAVRDEEHFFYVGSDDKFHYFETREGFYSLSRKIELPHFQKIIDIVSAREPGTFGIPVCIDGNTIAYWSSRRREANNQAAAEG